MHTPPTAKYYTRYTVADLYRAHAETRRCSIRELSRQSESAQPCMRYDAMMVVCFQSEPNRTLRNAN